MEKFKQATFLTWLEANRLSLTLRSRKDLVSRAKRVSAWIDLTDPSPTEDIVYALSKQPEFRGLQPTVKSQLKAAVKHYREYLNLP